MEIIHNEFTISVLGRRISCVEEYEDYDPRFSHDGGSYYQPTFDLSFVLDGSKFSLRIEDTSCGDFGGRFYAELRNAAGEKLAAAQWGELVEPENHYSTFRLGQHLDPQQLAICAAENIGSLGYHIPFIVNLDGAVIEVPLLKHRDYSFSATDTPDLAQYEDVFFGERDGSLEQAIRDVTLRDEVVRYRMSGSLSLFDPDLPSVGIEADRLDDDGKSVGKYLLLYIVAEEPEDLPPNPIWTEYVDVFDAPPDDIRAIQKTKGE